MNNAGVNPIEKEMLMGHDIGLEAHYHRPSEGKILEEYLKAVDLLTINNEHRLQKKVTALEQKQSELEYTQSKVQHLEQQMQELMLMAHDIMKVRDSVNRYMENPDNRISDAQLQKTLDSMAAKHGDGKKKIKIVKK
jgi:hypothetical protein